MINILKNNHTDPALIFPYHEKILEEFKTSLAELFKNRLHSIILYGSHARGDASSDSDLDILVVLHSSENINHDWDKCIDIATDMASRTGVIISVLVCLASDYAQRMHPLLMNARNEGILVS